MIRSCNPKGIATLAQLVEQRFRKPQVVGSSPMGGCDALPAKGARERREPLDSGVN